MKFVNLKNASDEVTFETALLRGIGEDGGLYFPKTIPMLTSDEIQSLSGATRQEIAALVLGKWLQDEISADDLAKIVAAASTFETPIVQVGDKKILELFHGPTLAFKDVAASYLAALMSYFNKKSGRHSTVLVATSGDTGGAIAHGFGGVSGVDVVVLYPKGRVSKLQLEQLRRTENNVWALEVDGSFDDCQKLVKRALNDESLVRQLHLTSANSINIGRLLPQSTYYAYAFGQLGDETGRFVVPSGNLGNVTGGLLAQAIGVPIPGFLTANNANDTFTRYIQEREYKPMDSVPTISNAMDVGAPNNLPRVVELLKEKSDVQTATVTDAETIDTIRSVYAETGYLLDPHTAVAWCASEKVISPSEKRDVIVSTASPLKFAEEIHEMTGIKVDNAVELSALQARPERYSEINNSIDDLRKFLVKYSQ